MNTDNNSPNQPSSVSAQQITKELVEIFKLRATSLLLNTLALYWPILAAIIVNVFSPFIVPAWRNFDSIAGYSYALLIIVFIFYSLPRIGLDRVEKRFWIQRFISKGEVVSSEDSKKFMRKNKSRILAYKRFVFSKYYFVPISVMLAPPVIVAMLLISGMLKDGGRTSDYIVTIFMLCLIATPIFISIFLFYWLHTRTTLLYIWERFVDALDNQEEISDKEIISEARKLVKVMGRQNKAKFMAYDFATSSAIGAPGLAVSQVTRLTPKPIERIINTYGFLYAINAYQLENLAIAYCFYLESKRLLNSTNLVG